MVVPLTCGYNLERTCKQSRGYVARDGRVSCCMGCLAWFYAVSSTSLSFRLWVCHTTCRSRSRMYSFVMLAGTFEQGGGCALELVSGEVPEKNQSLFSFGSFPRWPSSANLSLRLSRQWRAPIINKKRPKKLSGDVVLESWLLLPELSAANSDSFGLLSCSGPDSLCKLQAWMTGCSDIVRRNLACGDVM